MGHFNEDQLQRAGLAGRVSVQVAFGVLARLILVDYSRNQYFTKDLDDESVGSFTSLVILLDTRAAVVAIHTISLEISPKAPPLLVYVPASPDYVQESDLEEDPLEDDFPCDDAYKTTRLEVQATHAPPAPH
ncbi:hypothetical protein Tco_1072965 [Tanacetum coccineum]